MRTAERQRQLRRVLAITFGASAVVGAMSVPRSGAHDDGDSRVALSDLSPSTIDPTDGALARARVRDDEDRTVVTLDVRGLTDPGAVHGAHVHTGPCVAGDGAAAGPHFNAGGGISDQTEVWLDFEVRESGHGKAKARVTFVIPPGGAQSIVIHAAPTNPATGAAGARLACLPLEL